jgi:putative thioredoxin
VENVKMTAITIENFQQHVITKSKEQLVLVCFWAEQVPESVELKNALLIKLEPFSANISLATVDCQTQQQIAQQFGIQGVPTAILVKDGQPLDGISGPQSDETLTAFLDKHLPKAEDSFLAQAKELLAEKKLSEAHSAIEQAYVLNNDRADIKLVLCDVSIQMGKLEQAQALVDTILMTDQNADYHAILAKLELAGQAANSPEIQALEAQLNETPDAIDIKHQLAAQYNQVNRNEEALLLLFRLMQSDSSDDKSKTLFLDILKALPEGDPLANKYRRKLYTLMY